MYANSGGASSPPPGADGSMMGAARGAHEPAISPLSPRHRGAPSGGEQRNIARMPPSHNYRDYGEAIGTPRGMERSESSPPHSTRWGLSRNNSSTGPPRSPVPGASMADSRDYHPSPAAYPHQQAPHNSMPNVRPPLQLSPAPLPTGADSRREESYAPPQMRTPAPDTAYRPPRGHTPGRGGEGQGYPPSGPHHPQPQQHPRSLSRSPATYGGRDRAPTSDRGPALQQQQQRGGAADPYVGGQDPYRDPRDPHDYPPYGRPMSPDGGRGGAYDRPRGYFYGAQQQLAGAPPGPYPPEREPAPYYPAGTAPPPPREPRYGGPPPADRDYYVQQQQAPPPGWQQGPAGPPPPPPPHRRSGDSDRYAPYSYPAALQQARDHRAYPPPRGHAPIVPADDRYYYGPRGSTGGAPHPYGPPGPRPGGSSAYYREHSGYPSTSSDSGYMVSRGGSLEVQMAHGGREMGRGRGDPRAQQPLIRPAPAGGEQHGAGPAEASVAPRRAAGTRGKRGGRGAGKGQGGSGAAGGANRVCHNCGTHETTLWRRSILTTEPPATTASDDSTGGGQGDRRGNEQGGTRGELVCNACGTYERLHGRPRPVALAKRSLGLVRKRQRGLKGTPRSGSSRMPLDGLLDADRSGSQDSSTVLQTPSGSPHQFLSPAEGGRDSAAADIMSNSTPGGSVHHPLTSPGGPDVGGAHGYHLHDLRVTHHPLDQQQLMQLQHHRRQAPLDQSPRASAMTRDRGGDHPHGVMMQQGGEIRTSPRAGLASASASGGGESVLSHSVAELL